MNKNEFFEQIYDDYKDKIYEFIFYKVSNKELAEDLTSDVFISVYKNLHRYDAEKSFITTWLYAIAYNRLKNYYKSRKNNVYSIEYLIEMSNEIHIVKYDSSAVADVDPYSLIGEFITVRVIGADEYDLIAEILEI